MTTRWFWTAERSRSTLTTFLLLIVVVLFAMVQDKVDFNLLNQTATNEKTQQKKVSIRGSSNKHAVAAATNTQPTADMLNCTWTFPNNNNNNNNTDNSVASSSNSSSCFNHLLTRIQSTTSSPVKRWIFVGDSTMYRLFHNSQLQEELTQDSIFYNPPCPNYSCKRYKAERCEKDKLFGISRVDIVEDWKLPNNNNNNNNNTQRSEGPVAYGLDNPYCTDCWGCDSVVLQCLPDFPSSCKRRMKPTGGYVSVEFARDVEFQSKRHKTTQEQFAHYLERQWNTPNTTVVRDLGRPICVVSTGIHDALISNITLNSYITNVKDYVGLLVEQCAHLVWLGNASPETNDYVQTKEQTEQWNQAVHDLLRSNNPFWTKKNNHNGSPVSVSSSFVDVFETSVTAPHSDNIHMSVDWYKTLGTMFLDLVQALDDATHRRRSSIGGG